MARARDELQVSAFDGPSGASDISSTSATSSPASGFRPPGSQPTWLRGSPNSPLFLSAQPPPSQFGCATSPNVTSASPNVTFTSSGIFQLLGPSCRAVELSGPVAQGPAPHEASFFAIWCKFNWQLNIAGKFKEGDTSACTDHGSTPFVILLRNPICTEKPNEEALQLHLRLVPRHSFRS